MKSDNPYAVEKAVFLAASSNYFIPRNVENSRRTVWDIVWRIFVRKVFRRPEMWVDKFDVLESNIPRDVGAEVINICNARCSFCGYGKGEKGKAADYRVKGKLDREAYTHTLKLYNDAGGGIFSLSPILGEVSAHPDWLEMVREATSFPNISGVSSFTNAILLDKFGAEEILTSGIVTLSISTALGSNEQYQRVYGIDKYERVLSNIFDVLKTNARLGKPVNISLLLRIDKPYSNFLNSDLYDEIIEYISPQNIEILHDNWDNFKGLISEEGLPVGQSFKTTEVNKKLPCYAMYRKLQVMLDGKIQPCSCRVEPDLWCGNIKDYDSLEDAWRDPQLLKLRSDWHDGNLPECCTKCSHYQPYTGLISDSSIGVVLPQIGRALKRKMGNSRTK
jgi:radical SAM protein with 4Fe4S-binding SPASM domain